jgi:hypothetical protein
MARIFHVTVIKEVESTIIAESLEEAQKALEADDIDDWADAEREVRVMDPLEFCKRHPQMIPTNFSEPEAGVLDGKAVAFYDYLQKHPDWLEKVEANAREFRTKLTLDKVNEKLPGI